MVDPTQTKPVRAFLERLQSNHPKAAVVLSSFLRNPVSGNSLRLMMRGAITDESVEHVNSLRPPIMWNSSAPVIISQYVNYSSNKLPAFWNTVVPEIEERYGGDVRYEHHDAVPINSKNPDYKLATVGRAIQNNGTDTAFWRWFNYIMVEGVDSVDEAIDLIGMLDIDVEQSVIQEALDYDLYASVLGNDIDALLGKASNDQFTQYQTKLENNDPIFAVFVNGGAVDPSYDSLVGMIERTLPDQTVEE